LQASEDEIASFAMEQAKAGSQGPHHSKSGKGLHQNPKSTREFRTAANSEYLFNVNGVSAPHHSRFAPDDRKRLDHEIEKTFGKKTDKHSIIAVATQTVEQSLDIDADILITDLCPMDVLLQRIGRLHRHEQTRPDGFETAKCVILTPEERDLSESIDHNGKGSKGKHGLGTVYQDLRTIEATWRVLEDESMVFWNIPEHNRELVERATHPIILRSLVEELVEIGRQHQQHIAGQEFADKQLPGLVGIDFSKPFGESGFAEDLKQVKTRLGRDDYRIKLSKGVETALSEKSQ
jgi:CRISPR-associated endonuclease/helicase Cas3